MAPVNMTKVGKPRDFETHGGEPDDHDTKVDDPGDSDNEHQETLKTTRS